MTEMTIDDAKKWFETQPERSNWKEKKFSLEVGQDATITIKSAPKVIKIGDRDLLGFDNVKSEKSKYDPYEKCQIMVLKDGGTIEQVWTAPKWATQQMGAILAAAGKIWEKDLVGSRWYIKKTMNKPQSGVVIQK